MAYPEKKFIKALGKKFNLNDTDSELKIFDVLWELFQIGRKYDKDNKNKISESLSQNYLHLIAAILNKRNFNEFLPGDVILPHSISNNVFKRIKSFPLFPKRTRLPATGNMPISAALGPKKFVIFSDHHMTEKRHRHNYFSKNKSLYKDVLRYYSDEGYGLIENGDVEEYVIFEPTIKIANGYNNLIDKSGGPLGFDRDVGKVDWNDLRNRRTQNRIKILTSILDDNRDLYDLIDEKFASKGDRYYTRITGNHDMYLKTELIDLLPVNIKKNLCDALRITHIDRLRNVVIDEPRYFITHGHQFDASTLPQHAWALGEVYSETMACFIQGADRIWDTQKTLQWRKSARPKEFRNILASGKPDTNLPAINLQPLGINFSFNIETILESLMNNHEIAWEYFDHESQLLAVTEEVFKGDEYFKVRHLSETKLVEKLDYFYSHTDIKHFKHEPKLIIGHTHEPRRNAKKGETVPHLATNYLNSGSAGRFENLIWGIELADGKEKIISWSKEGNTMKRYRWGPSSIGTLNRRSYPH